MPFLSNPPATIAPGLIETVEAAGHSVNRGPDGWLVDDATAVQAIVNSYSGSAAELQWHQQQKLLVLGAHYEGLIAAGRIYTVPNDPSGAHTYQIDAASLFDIDAKALKANLAINNVYAWNPGFYWVAADNSHVPMTAQQMQDFANNVDTYITALFLNYQGVKAQIISAATVAAVDAIDITQGWPSNP